MRTIFSDRERDALLRRIDTLTPESPRQWGRMSAHQMVCHLTAAINSGYAPPPARPATGPLTHFPLNWLVINVLPWPKGKLESPPELFDWVPTTWEADVAALRSALERAAARGPDAPWPATPVFGAISGRSWGALLRKHIDHHLRQFKA
jgi:hypothetical protein